MKIEHLSLFHNRLRTVPKIFARYSERSDAYEQHKKLKLGVQDIQSRKLKSAILSDTDNIAFDHYKRHFKEIYHENLLVQENKIIDGLNQLSERIKKWTQKVYSGQPIDVLEVKDINKDLFFLVNQHLKYMQSYPWTRPENHYLNTHPFFYDAFNTKVKKPFLLTNNVYNHELLDAKSRKNMKATALYSEMTIFLGQEVKEIIYHFMFNTPFAKELAERFLGEKAYCWHTKDIMFPRAESVLQGVRLMNAYGSASFSKLEYHQFSNKKEESSNEDIGFCLTVGAENTENKVLDYIKALSKVAQEADLTDDMQFKQALDLVFRHSLANRCFSAEIMGYRFSIFMKLAHMCPETRQKLEKQYLVQDASWLQKLTVF
jgi:hypothetical protein